MSDPASRDIWLVHGPASRVAHAPCRCPDRPDKRGPDRVQIRPGFVRRSEVTIVPAIVARDQAAAMSYCRLTN